MHRSKISWTDYSGGYANFVWRGSTPGDCEVSPGCAHCYVDRSIIRLGDKWPQFTTVFPEKLDKLARCRPAPGKVPYRCHPSKRPMVFICDTGDLFHAFVPTDFIFRAFDVFLARNDIDFQLLTKRSWRMKNVVHEWLEARKLLAMPRNIWCMVTAENQEQADIRLRDLAEIPAVRGVSFEPLLSAIDFSAYAPWIHWAIIGGESGKGARPMHPDWTRGIIETSRKYGIHVHFKQWGAYIHESQESLFRPSTENAHAWEDGTFSYKVGHNNVTSLFDGEMIREFPLFSEVTR